MQGELLPGEACPAARCDHPSVFSFVSLGSSRGCGAVKSSQLFGKADISEDRTGIDLALAEIFRQERRTRPQSICQLFRDAAVAGSADCRVQRVAYGGIGDACVRHMCVIERRGLDALTSKSPIPHCSRRCFCTGALGLVVATYSHERDESVWLMSGSRSAGAVQCLAIRRKCRCRGALTAPANCMQSAARRGHSTSCFRNLPDVAHHRP